MTGLSTKIVRNSSVLFLSYIFNQIFILLAGLLTARGLGANYYGVISFAAALSQVVSIVLDVGVHQLVIREVAKDHSLGPEIFSVVIALKVLLTMPYLLLIYTISIVLHLNGQVAFVLFLISVAFLLNSFLFFLYALFQAFEQFVYVAGGQIINAFLFLSLTAIVFTSSRSVIDFALIPLFVNLITVVAFLVMVNSLLFKLRVIRKFLILVPMIKSALPFGLTSIFVTIYLWNGMIFLTIFAGTKATGLFSAPFKIVLALLGISYALNTTIFPIMSQMFLSKPNKLLTVARKQLKVLLLVSIPMAFGGTFLAQDFIYFFLGDAFSTSTVIFQILIWTLPFIFARSSFERYFESNNHQHLVTISYGIGVVISLVFNLLLIPSLQYIGAGLAMLFSDIAIFTSLAFFARKSQFNWFQKNQIQILFKIIIASCVMLVFLLLFPRTNLLFQLGLGIISYLFIITLLNVLEKDDLKILKQAIGK